MRLPAIQVLYFDTVEDFVDELTHSSQYFTLLLAWNALLLPSPALIEKLRPLVDRGLVYFCAWGERCEAVHDAVDQCDIERMKRPGSEDYIVMTTWHNNEPLEEAVWFFNELAIPTEPPLSEDFERFAVAIGNRAWAVEIEQTLLNNVS